jgi:hypothetical protein
MSNPNTISDAIMQQNNGAPIVLAATSTLHKSFSLGGAAVVISVPNPMAGIDSSTNFPGRSAGGTSFLIRAVGQVTGGEPYTIDINQGTGLTPTIASTGNAANGRTADNWSLEVLCSWDPTSLFLRGIFYGWAGPNQVANQSLLAVVSPANLAALVFNCAVTISSANANASFTLSDFSIDLS